MSDKQLIIVDFDGTLTHIEKDAEHFRPKFLPRMSEELGISLDEFEQMVSEQEDDIERHPDLFGFTRCGRIVAPSNADPYILPYEAVRFIMHRMNALENNDDAIQEVIYRVFLEVIGMLGNSFVFRDGIEEFLFSVQPEPVYIVSSSSEKLLYWKIRTLGTEYRWVLSRAMGDANKYGIADTLNGVPETFQLPEYYRPIFIRRHQYYWMLDGLRRQHQVEWSDMLVIGDIFEADGALPFALGARFALMLREKSLQHEVNFLRSHPRGMVISGLDEARELLG